MMIGHYTVSIITSNMAAVFSGCMLGEPQPHSAILIYHSQNGYDIHLCWVPGHANIRGNERADRAAKKALNCDVEPCLIPHSDLKPLIVTHIKAKWQLEWDGSINKIA